MSLLYKECARIISLVVAGRGSVKTLCLSTRNKAKTKVYAIVFNVLQSEYSCLLFYITFFKFLLRVDYLKLSYKVQMMIDDSVRFKI